VLLVLTAVIQLLAGPLAFTRPIFAVLAVASWAWLGWALYSKANTPEEEQQIARQGIPANASR
jgi:hypothetical protein